MLVQSMRNRLIDFNDCHSNNVIFLPPAVQSFTYLCLITDCYLKGITFLDTAETVNDNASTLAEVLKSKKSHMNNIKTLLPC